MILTAASLDTVTIDNPEYGYVSTANLAIEPVETSHGWDTWNNGIEYDFRTCLLSRFNLDEVVAYGLDQFILAHRGESLTMTLDSDSGFFPFGPDLGDTGDFIIQITDRKFGEFDQFKQYSKSISLLLETAPAYTLPSVDRMHTLQIGSVLYLPYPQTGISPNLVPGIQTGVSYGGDGYSIDIQRRAHETSFTLQCNESLPAHLMAFLTGALGRNQDITIVAPDEYYLFGTENGSSGTYVCKLIQKKIECTHVENEQFEIPLSFWMKSKA